MLPVEADVVELLVDWGQKKGASTLMQASADLCFIAFFFLLRVGEYTCKDSRNETEQTVQFRMKDVTFLKKGKAGRLRQLPHASPEWMIMSANGATLTLSNQKNDWQNVSIHHEWSGDDLKDVVRSIGRRFCHICRHMGNNWETFLSSAFTEEGRCDVTDNHVREALKAAAATLQYPEMRGINLEHINTHSLRVGGTNALAL